MMSNQDSDYIMFLRGCQPLVLVLFVFTVPRGLPDGRLTFTVGSKFSMPGFSANQSHEYAHRCPHNLLRIDETRKALSIYIARFEYISPLTLHLYDFLCLQKFIVFDEAYKKPIFHIIPQLHI